MNEGLLLGLVLGGLLFLVLWRTGVRMTPRPEALATIVLGIGLFFVFRETRVFDPSTSVFAGFVAAVIVIALWKRFAHRPI